MRTIKTLAVVAAAAAGTLLSVGSAQADDVIVGWNGVPYTYSSERACLSDGPDTHLEENDEFYPYYYCTQVAHGAWVLHNTDQP